MKCSVLTEGGRCKQQSLHNGVCSAHQKWQHGRNGQLGFNLIVKNEGAVLERCLKNIRLYADQIVVTDTGSTDDTVAIALRYADRVLFHEWQDSFSESRNFSLQFSTTEWVCWIDADEMIVPETADKLDNLLRMHGTAKTIFCALLSDLPDGRCSKHYLPKIFRCRTAHFEGIVHNQLVHDVPVIMSDVAFRHTGYNLDEKTMKQKRERTANLLRQQIADDPEDSFALMNLARTQLGDSDYSESLGTAMRGLASDKTTGPCREMLLYNQAICGIHLKDYQMAESACWEGLDLNFENLDLTFLLAWSSIRSEEWTKAIVYFERYLILRKTQETDGFNFLILDFWDAREQALNYIGVAHRALKNYEAAANAHRRAIALNQSDIIAWKQLALTYQTAKEPEKARRVISKIIDLGIADSEVWNEVIAN